MTRREFLNELYRLLGKMSREEAEQYLTYYAEMLADRMEEGMTEEEAHQETSRCLRCDHFGYGIFKGGRSSKW